MRPSMILLLRSFIRFLMLSLSLRPRMRYSSKRVTYSSQSCLVILPSWKLSKLSFRKEIMAGKFSSAEKYCLVFCPFCSISAVALSLALVSPACPQPKSSMLMMTFMRNRVSEGSRLEAYSAFLTPSATSPIFIRMKDWMQKDFTRPGSSSKVLPMCCMLLGQSPMAQQRIERLLWYMTSVGAFSTASRCLPMDSLYLASSKYFTPMLDRFSSPYSLSFFFTLSNSYRMWSQVSKSFCRRCGSIRLSHSRPPELSIEGRYLAAHFSSSSIFFVILSRLPSPSSKKSQFNCRACSLSLRERAMLPSFFRHSEYRQRALAKVGQIRRAASSMGLALLNLPSRIQSAADLTARYACWNSFRQTLLGIPIIFYQCADHKGDAEVCQQEYQNNSLPCFLYYSMISKMTKVSVLARGFLNNRGATPLNHQPVCIKDRISFIRCWPPIEYVESMPRVWMRALISSKG